MARKPKRPKQVASLTHEEAFLAGIAANGPDDVYETERQLFYVACTRARDRLLVTGIAPGSEFLGDPRLTQ